MTSVSRNIESGFYFVLGTSLKNLIRDYNNYYSAKFVLTERSTISPTKELSINKSKKPASISQFKKSPDGKYATFVLNYMGQYKLFLYNNESKKSKLIMKVGKKLERINDYSYPIVSWHPTSEMMAIITEVKSEIVLTYYSIKEHKKIKHPPLFGFDKILDFSYSDDGKNMVFSAVKNGNTDIYIYNVAANSSKALTDDVYDDLNPRFIQHSTAIIFSSNRTSDSLKSSENPGINHDLFIYNLYSNNKSVLKRYTNTPAVNEKYPYPFNDSKIIYLGDNNGIVNRYISESDSSLSYVDTTEHYSYFTVSKPLSNSSRNIIEHDYIRNSQKYTQIIYYNVRCRMYEGTN
jgi:Tol biopolymer transport system component